MTVYSYNHEDPSSLMYTVTIRLNSEKSRSLGTVYRPTYVAFTKNEHWRDTFKPDMVAKNNDLKYLCYRIGLPIA